MRLAIVALTASLAILAAVITNFSGDGSDLPPPAMIELSGMAPPDTPMVALAPPLEPPAPPPPLPVQEAAKRPSTAVAAVEQGSSKQAAVERVPTRAPVGQAHLPARGGVEEVRRHVSFSSTREYRYNCDDDEEDADDRNECNEDDKADLDDPDKPDRDNDADEDEASDSQQ